MDRHDLISLTGRRAFLKAALPGGALLCLGGRCLLASPRFQEKAPVAGQKHKFLEDAGMSFAEVFRATYAPQVSLFRGLEKEIGTEKLFAMLKRVIDEDSKRESAEFAKSLGKNDLAAYTKPLKEPNRFWQHALTFETVEDTPRAYEVKVTECIWAKTLREAKAADLGYILSCYGDYAAAEGFNPKMRMIRTKTLMQGDDFCNHRYVIEA